MESDLIIQIGQEQGYFKVHEKTDGLSFETPVLEHVDCVSPGVRKYIDTFNEDPYMLRQSLFIDEENGALLLRGSWDFSRCGAELFDRIIVFVKETAEEVKRQLYKTLCQDLVYLVANTSYAQTV